MIYGYIRPLGLYDTVEQQKLKLKNTAVLFEEKHAHNLSLIHI